MLSSYESSVHIANVPNQIFSSCWSAFKLFNNFPKIQFTRFKLCHLTVKCCLFSAPPLLYSFFLQTWGRGTQSTIDFIQGRKVHPERANSVHRSGFPEEFLRRIFCAHGHFASDCIRSNIVLYLSIGTRLGRTQTPSVTFSLPICLSLFLT